MERWINEPVWVKYNNTWNEGIVEKISLSLTEVSHFIIEVKLLSNNKIIQIENENRIEEENTLNNNNNNNNSSYNSYNSDGNSNIYQRSSYNNISECEDLLQLSNINEPEVLYLLNERYKKQLIYTTIGSILLSVNPFKNNNRYNNQITNLYIHQGEIRNLKILPPHIFKIADSAYRRMFLDLFDSDQRENQSIVITGDSGAGKTESSKDLLYYFCRLSPTNNKSSNENNIEDLVLLSYPITESFGNAKTSQNDNSSRFGKYIELYYSTEGSIEGVNIRTYLLEATRVSHHSINERNFHIFYEIFSGLSNEDKKQWGFEKLNNFYYLNYNNLSSNDENDDRENNLIKYQQLLKSFERFSIPTQTQREIYKILIGILHIGNIEFTSLNKDNSNNYDESYLSQNETTQYHLQKACELMGYTKETLQEIFCYETTTVNGIQVKKQVSISVSISMRDRLARTLYYSLFKWIVTEVNCVLGEKISENIVSFIGLLDIFGFENIEQNSFEQLCINYTHEKLKGYYYFIVFENEQKLYQKEGVKYLHIFSPKELDNTSQIDLFENPITGIFSVLNDYMKQPESTDEKYLEALIRKNQQNPLFSTSSNSETIHSPDLDNTSSLNSKFKKEKEKYNFTLLHYNIPVTYSTENILEKNRGIREINFMTFNGANRVYSSDNSQHINALMKKTSTQLSSSDLQSNQELTKSISVGIDTKKSIPIHTSISKKSKTISGVYQSDVCDLIIKLQQTHSHFVICLKPNQNKSSIEYNSLLMSQQIKSYGLLETCKVTSNSISCQLQFSIFLQKYRVILYGIGYCSFTRDIFNFLHHKTSKESLSNYKSIIIKFIDILSISQLILNRIYHYDQENNKLIEFSKFIKVGQSHVFLLGSIFESLERLNYLTTEVIAKKLQRIWKIYKFKKTVKIITIQSLQYFNYILFKKIQLEIRSAILIQRQYRVHRYRKQYKKILELSRQNKELENQKIKSIIKCQAIIRGWLCRIKLKKMNYNLSNDPRVLMERVVDLELTIDAMKRKTHKSNHPRRDRIKTIVTAERLFPLIEGDTFLKVCRSGKTHETKVCLTYDRRYLQWIPNKYSLKRAELCLIDLTQITFLHRGHLTPRFHHATHLANQINIKHRSFSLVGTNGNTLDLVASSVEVADEWIECLQFLIFDIYTARRDLYLIWSRLITGEGINEEVDFLNILDEKIDDYVKEELISVRNFASFWASIQDHRIPSRSVMNAINLALPDFLSTCEYMTFQAFYCFVTANENSAFDNSRLDMYHDMTHPLSHYFIHSSDHSNIIVNAKSSEDYLKSYKNDLENGCKVLEIHCWDGDKYPIVSSYINTSDSLTLSKIDIPLEKVLNLIKENAFINSPYPLILLIENHCSLKMQEMVSYYLLAVFGELLIPANEIAYGSDDTERYLPSPLDLCGKVILILSDEKHKYSTFLDDEMIKKKLQRPVVTEIISNPHATENNDDNDDNEKNENENDDGKESITSRNTSYIPQDSSLSIQKYSMTTTSNRDSMVSLSSTQTESFYHPNLRELATMTSKMVLDVKLLQHIDIHYLLGCSEVDMLLYLSKNDAIPWLKLNSTHLSRIFCDYRLNESNNIIDPIRAWSIGTSMVFIDHHNSTQLESSIVSLISKEKFKDNGNCGYVIKPQYAISKKALPFPPVYLLVHIISAQWLPEMLSTNIKKNDNDNDNDDEIILLDPYVVVEVRGLPQDNNSYETLTSGGPGRLDNPMWDEVFGFDIDAPDAAHLILKLFLGDEIIGSASIPIPCLNQGFRHVELYSKDSKRLPYTTLTIRTTLTKKNDVEKRLYYDSPESSQYEVKEFMTEFQTKQKNKHSQDKENEKRVRETNKKIDQEIIKQLD